MRAAVREHVPKRCLRAFGPALPLRAKASPDGWQSPFFPGRFHRWERLELSCCITLQRLTDPAKGVGCSHRARQTPAP